MLACIFIFNLALSQAGFAASFKTPSPSNPDGSGRIDSVEDEDYTTTPYTEYGEFQEDANESEVTRFFQYGRFFGVSLGLGVQNALGNRAQLWRGGFPAIDFKVHYWFDFSLALDLGVFFVSHFYDDPNTTTTDLGRVDVNVLRLGINFRYYIDIKNLSAAITFANPFIVGGLGSFNRTDNSIKQNTSNPESNYGLSFGAGLEFPIKPKASYFQIEGKGHLVKYKDTFSEAYRPQIADLTGPFFSFIASILFTW